MARFEIMVNGVSVACENIEDVLALTKALGGDYVTKPVQRKAVATPKASEKTTAQTKSEKTGKAKAAGKDVVLNLTLTEDGRNLDWGGKMSFNAYSVMLFAAKSYDDKVVYDKQHKNLRFSSKAKATKAFKALNGYVVTAEAQAKAAADRAAKKAAKKS